jgi:hypothetical protein
VRSADCGNACIGHTLCDCRLESSVCSPASGSAGMACQSSACTPSIAILRRQVPPQHSLSMAAFDLTLDLHDLPFTISTDRMQDINCRTSAERVHDTCRGAHARTISCAESVEGCWAGVTAQQLATLPAAAANLLVAVRGHHILSSRTAACHGLDRLSASALPVVAGLPKGPRKLPQTSQQHAPRFDLPCSSLTSDKTHQPAATAS